MTKKLPALILSIILMLSLLALVHRLPKGAVSQEYSFSHIVHSNLNCGLCHGSEWTRIPERKECLGCHKNIETGIFMDTVWKAEGVYPSPSFQNINTAHYAHSRAGISCSSCHRVENPHRERIQMDMNFCINCHRREREGMVKEVPLPKEMSHPNKKNQNIPPLSCKSCHN
jgi:hypothetical protein